MPRRGWPLVATILAALLLDETLTWWFGAGFVLVVLGLGFAAIQAATLSPQGVLEPQRAAIGVSVFGVPVLMILSAMSVTGEYRSGMIRTTFLATPRRAWALTAKAIVMGALSAVVTGAMVVAAVVFARTDEGA